MVTYPLHQTLSRQLTPKFSVEDDLCCSYRMTTMTAMYLCKTSLLFTLLSFSSFVLGSHEHLYSLPSDSVEWDFCELDYTETCEPTISIEQAACMAPLVVYGRVLQVDTTTDAVEIQVDYRSHYFGEHPQGVAKWGAGLENEQPGSPFFEESGFFTTWVTGFNNTQARGATSDGISPCGTKYPRSQDELYLFLESQPETADKAVEISDRAALNVNFTLSSTSLRSGTAHADLEAWDLIRNGIFNDDYKLNGDCQVVYCCYNPGCEQCSQNLFDKYPNFRCPDWTPKGMEEEEEDSSSAARLLGMAIAVATGVLGLLLN